MARPASPVPDALPEVARAAIVGDWGTGMYGAPAIARAIRDDPDPFAVLMHLGDVYYWAPVARATLLDACRRGRTRQPGPELQSRHVLAASRTSPRRCRASDRRRATSPSRTSTSRSSGSTWPTLITTLTTSRRSGWRT